MNKTFFEKWTCVHELDGNNSVIGTRHSVMWLRRSEIQMNIEWAPAIQLVPFNMHVIVILCGVLESNPFSNYFFNQME